MIDITHKSNTLRFAVAQAVVKVSRPETIQAVVDKTVPKGDVMEAARIAALFAVKKTADIIPDCHPLPVEHTAVESRIEGLEIIVEVTVQTLYKTGVEVEAMHGASVAALTMYDMLKPLDKDIEITTIRLLEKRGGKSDFNKQMTLPVQAAVVVVSDSVSAGKKQDTAGKAIIDKLKGMQVEIVAYEVIPDEEDQIRNLVSGFAQNGVSLVITTGGTGLSPRDKTPQAIRTILDEEIPGVMEAARSYGQDRTPYAMLSRGVAGLIGRTLVLTLPGSTRGASETMDALFPQILHIFKVLDIAYKHLDMHTQA